MGKKKTPLCIVFTVVERSGAEKVARAYERTGIGFHYRLSGEGTASSDLLDILGIGTSERDILISPTDRGAAEALVDMIHREGLSGAHTKGIMCVLPLTAASVKAANLLLNRAKDAEEGKIDGNRRQAEYDPHCGGSGIYGGSDDDGEGRRVPAAAQVSVEPCLKSKEHESFGGPTFAGERELILIVASQGERNAIMERVDAVHGGEAGAHAIMYSLPIEQTAHLGSKMEHLPPEGGRCFLRLFPFKERGK